jgi:serine phosphatase RsbU (regulator of sigma subunit)/PAS domain-containing protein
LTTGEPKASITGPTADEAVWRLANALASSVTSFDVAEALALEGGAAGGGSFANMAVVENGSGRILVFRRLAGVTGWRTQLADEPACDAIRSGMPVLLGSLQEIARRYPGVLDLIKSAGLQAGSVWPVFAADGGTLGAVGFGWDTPQQFSASQLRRLDLISHLTGLALDRTITRESGARQADGLEQVLEEMPNGFCAVDPDFRVSAVNLQAARLLDAGRMELVGASLFDLFPDAPAGNFEPHFRRAMETGRTVEFEDYCSGRGSWFEIRASPGAGGLNVYFSNIDQRRSSELQRLVALDKANHANSRLSLLTRLSDDLTGVSTRTEVFERVARNVVGTTMGDWCTIVVPRGDGLVRVAAAHSDPVLDALIKRLIGSYPQPFSGPSPGVVVYRSGTSLRLERLAQQIIADLDDSAASTGYGRTLELLGDGPGLITPIITDEKVVAVLTTVRKAGEPYTDEDVETGNEVAARIASSLDDARHVEVQRETASALQDASLPKALPDIARLGLAAGYRAASEGVGVGGDWYDAFELQTGRVAAVVGDVAGHGVGAAALMAQMRNTLRAHLFSLVGLAESLHRLSCQLTLQERVFATAICVEIDPATGEMSWASAGHPAPILVSADGTSLHLQGRPAPPIGWMHSSLPQPATEHRTMLAPGERLLLFTDGMIERRGIDIDIGITHLMLHAEQTRSLGTAEACETILRETLQNAHEDDACLLIADFVPQPQQ